MNTRDYTKVPSHPEVEVNQEGDVRYTATKMSAIKVLGNDNRMYTRVDNYKQAPVCELVIEAFFGPVPEGQKITHKGSLADDRLSNLTFTEHGDPGPQFDALRAPAKPKRRFNP